MEVVSAKQKGVKGSMIGSGETQLEIEKRKISQRETIIKEQLVLLSKRRLIEREKRSNQSNQVPLIALVNIIINLATNETIIKLL